MIKYKIKHPDFLIMALNTIVGCHTDKTVLQFGGKIRSYGLDGGRIAAYEVIIGKSQLDIIEDGKIDVMIHVPSLASILKRFTHPDELTVIYDQNRVKIKGKIGNRNKTFSLSTLAGDAPDDAMKTLSTLQLNAAFNINMSELRNMIDDVNVYSEKFSLHTEGNEVFLDAVNPMGYVKSGCFLEDEPTANDECDYSLLYAKDILKAMGNQEVTISFGKDLPMMIYSKLAEDSYVKWFLAPRVEQD